MKRIADLFERTSEPVLNVYFTAGFPSLTSTAQVLNALEKAGADMVEIGMPYSDPLADGQTIQESSTVALQNGMSIQLLFDQLKDCRKTVELPIVLMGYLNPILQFGTEAFFRKCEEVGVDGLIIPDLPQELFDSEFKDLAQRYNQDMIFLITPETSEERIRKIDERCSGFLYMVSSSSTTGASSDISEEQKKYFERIQSMKLRNKRLIGFGISDRKSFEEASKWSDGAIVGSAFIRQLRNDASNEAIEQFIKRLKS